MESSPCHILILAGINLVINNKQTRSTRYAVDHATCKAMDRLGSVSKEWGIGFRVKISMCTCIVCTDGLYRGTGKDYSLSWTDPEGLPEGLRLWCGEHLLYVGTCE
jgi:hypothetical protein